MFWRSTKPNYKVHGRNWHFAHCLCGYIFFRSGWIVYRNNYGVCYIHLLHVEYYMLIMINNAWALSLFNKWVHKWSKICNYLNWASDEILMETGWLGYFFNYYFMRRKITFYICHNFNNFQVICSFPLLLKHMHSLLPGRTGPSQNLQISKSWIWAYFLVKYLKMFPFKFSLSKWCTTVNNGGSCLRQSLKFSLGIWTPCLLALPTLLALINNAFLIVDTFPLLPCKLSAAEYGSGMQSISGTQSYRLSCPRNQRKALSNKAVTLMVYSGLLFRRVWLLWKS